MSGASCVAAALIVVDQAIETTSLQSASIWMLSYGMCLEETVVADLMVTVVIDKPKLPTIRQQLTDVHVSHPLLFIE